MKFSTFLIYSLFILASVSYANTESLSNSNCQNALKSFFYTKEYNVPVSKEKFTEYYDNLNETLSGNLATVFRSEWKAKENYDVGSKYLSDLLKENGGDEILKKYGKIRGKEFVERVIDHLREKEKLGKISMRDPPAPKGSTDRTFTYYTKALTDGTGAKHQVRLRTYLRQLDILKMDKNISVQGYFNGNYIEIKKLNENSFEFIQTARGTEEKIVKTLTLDELKKEINPDLMFYAYPHAKNFKLEIKTRPHDEVTNKQFEKLLGKNYVQKLSIDINPDDIELLFKNVSTKNLAETKERLKILKERALKNPKNSKERTDAIFQILEDGMKLDENFLVAQGATEYRRYAIEVEIPDKIDGEIVRVQTTFDYDMGVVKNYDQSGKFLDPFQSQQNDKLRPFSKEEELHIELKVPKVLVEKSAKGESSPELNKLMYTFNQYQVTNKGKFKHISKQKEIDE